MSVHSIYSVIVSMLANTLAMVKRIIPILQLARRRVYAEKEHSVKLDPETRETQGATGS